ncbi:MAG: hypothetical protein ACREGG_04755 [Candidatus Saccharimonadales bacterium]
MQPQSPNKDFDFMLKDKPAAGSRFSWAHLHGHTQVTLGVIAGVILLIVAFSLLSGRNNGSSQDFVGVLARGQETLRVTQVAQQLNLQDPQSVALAATVDAGLSSDQVQLKNYLAKNKISISDAQLAADKDSSTDASLQSASQNNNLDGAYVSYLKTALTQYETDLQTTYKSVGPNGKNLLQTAFGSANTLLTTSPLK